MVFKILLDIPKVNSGWFNKSFSNLQYPGPFSVLFLAIVNEIGLWSDRLV